MASESVKIFYRFGGVFKSNPTDEGMLYEGGILRSTLFPRNGSYVQLKTHLEKLTGCKTTNMNIMHTIDHSPGFRIFINVQEDDDVLCLLFGVETVEIFVSTKVFEQTRLIRPIVTVDHAYVVTIPMTQPTPVTQVPCSFDAPSPSFRQSNENDRIVIVSNIDPELGHEWKDNMDSPRRIDHYQVPPLRTRKRSKTITRKAAKLPRTSEISVTSFFDSLPRYKQARRLRYGRKINSIYQKELNTNVFESYLEVLWSNISEEKRSDYTYLDCLWFCLYKDELAKTKVLKWIKRKQIFSRKYVFVPIICWRHWNLLILCHFGEKRRSKTKYPCMLLLDSLQKMDPKRLEPDIRRFVFDIYRSEGRKEEEELILDIPLLVPKVPQQRNGEECGIFVLYFIFLFLQSTPGNFSQKGYPYFLNENWFDLEDMDSFKKEVHSFRM